METPQFSLRQALAPYLRTQNRRRPRGNESSNQSWRHHHRPSGLLSPSSRLNREDPRDTKHSRQSKAHPASLSELANMYSVWMQLCRGDGTHYREYIGYILWRYFLSSCL